MEVGTRGGDYWFSSLLLTTVFTCTQLPWKKYTPPLDIKGPGVSRYIVYSTVLCASLSDSLAMCRLEKDFKIVDKLGEGEMSVVYRIQNRENLKESAVKIMALPRK